MKKDVFDDADSLDPILEKIRSLVDPPLFLSTKSIFHDLISCIIEQQIHYRSTRRIFEKMLDRANIKVLTPENFPVFEEKSLRFAKLSNSKYETLERVLEFWKVKTIDWESLTDDEIHTSLSKIKGVGKWTIDMILLYTLARPTIFPVDDFHLKNAMISLYTLDPKTQPKKQMTEISANWGNQKSMAVLYILAWRKQSISK